MRNSTSRSSRDEVLEASIDEAAKEARALLRLLDDRPVTMARLAGRARRASAALSQLWTMTEAAARRRRQR